jgi:hypothetical protein
MHILFCSNSEMLFSTDYLCTDAYMRSYMDVEGYLPIAFVANYPNVACYGAPYQDLVDKLASVSVRS